MLCTALTEMFGLQHPIIPGPMGGVAGGELAAVVSSAGALGMVGGIAADAEAQLRRGFGLLRSGAAAP